MILRLLAGATLVAASCSVSSGQSEQRVAEKPVSRILFGSCIRQDHPMPILKTMRAADPQLLIFLGDNIYADTSDMQVMRTKYETLGKNQSFVNLCSVCPVLATWDDHDYGVNDGGADFSARDSAQRVFLDFWGKYSDVTSQPHEGIYHARCDGPPGKRLQVISLDTRYFRSPLKRGPRRTGGPYVPDPDPQKTLLGESQWDWLEQQLRRPAEVRVIVSSIQCLAAAAGQETWANLPLERSRLFQLIRKSGADGVILISGDRHWAELSIHNDAVGYPLYDLTSSSLNQKHPRGTPTENRFRAVETTFHEENFGVIEIDWQQPDPQLRLEIRDTDNRTRIDKQIRLSELQSP